LLGLREDVLELRTIDEHNRGLFARKKLEAWGVVVGV
jgi:hypothetical protein